MTFYFHKDLIRGLSGVFSRISMNEEDGWLTITEGAEIKNIIAKTFQEIPSLTTVGVIKRKVHYIIEKLLQEGFPKNAVDIVATAFDTYLGIYTYTGK